MKDWMVLTIVFAIIMGIYYIFEKGGGHCDYVK